MKKVKNLIPLVALILALATLSSCNRGMGCPNNFSIKTFVKVVDSASSAIIVKP